MRTFIKLLTILGYFLALAWSAAIEQTEQKAVAPETILDLLSAVEHSNEGKRQVRQTFGYYGRPPYGGYYGSYGRPYYGSYGSSQLNYNRYGGYYRPYYGGYGGFYG